MTFAQLLGGSAIIENVFSWPGIGFYAVQAVFARDYPVVQAYVLIVAVLFVLVNLCVDLLQARIDPRARLALEQSAAQDRCACLGVNVEAVVWLGAVRSIAALLRC